MFFKIDSDNTSQTYEDDSGFICLYVSHDGSMTLYNRNLPMYIWPDGAYFIDNPDGDVISVGSRGTDEFNS